MPIRVAPPANSTAQRADRKGPKRVAPPGRKRRPPGISAEEYDFWKKHKGDRSVGGFLENVGEGFKDLAVGSAVGVVETGKAGINDVSELTARAFGRSGQWGRKRKKKGLRTDDLGRAILQDYARRYGDFSWDTLYEDPVPYVLDALTVASAGAGAASRVSAAAKASRGGRGAALRHGPPTQRRYAKNPDTDTQVLLGAYSRSALARGTQKFLDGIRQQFPNTPILGRSIYRKIGFQQGRIAQIEENLGRIQADELRAAAKGMNAAQHRALRVKAEGVPISQRIAKHKADLATATKARTARRLRGEIRLLEKTRKYVDEAGNLTDPRVAAVYDLAKASAKRREDMLALIDELAPERAAARIRQPSKFFDAAEAGETFFTYSTKKRPTAISRLGANRSIRHPNKPGTTQEFTGKAIDQGRVPKGEAILAAEAELEAWRYTTILRNRDRLIQLAKPQPTRGSDVAIVLDELRGKTLPEEVRAFLDKAAASEVLPEEELAALARIGEGVREAIFPGKWQDLQRLERFRAATDGPVPGVVWIDKRLLGRLHSPNPLVGFSQNAAAKATLSTVDAINNASKFAILYLFPFKYISPNLISQAAFALIQQGFSAPRHLAQASRLNAKLGRREQLAIDGGMGEGFAASIAGSTTGPLTRLNQTAARLYGKVIDLPFRRASFLKEAERAGFKTPAEIRKLLFDDDLRDTRMAVFLEANSEIIDYARLGRFERNVIRRVVFFYPWVKGATVYGGRFVAEHPGKAWALDQLGKIGTPAQEEALGALLPSYAEALAPVGESGGLPLTVNLGAVSPFTTPYGVARTLSGDQRSAYNMAGVLSPAFESALAALGMRAPDSYPQHIPGIGKTVGKAPYLGTFANEWISSLPPTRYVPRAIEGPNPKQAYPATSLQTLLAMLLGTGVAPRRTNPKVLREQAERGR